MKLRGRTEVGGNLARIDTLAARIADLAGRRMDALAKSDPANEMARIQVDDLRWRLRSLAGDFGMAEQAGLSRQDIRGRLSRMARAIGGSPAPSVLSVTGVERHQIKTAATWLDHVTRELDAREEQEVSADDVLCKLGEVSRALHDTPHSNTFIVTVLATCMENAIRWSHGQLMQTGPHPRSPLAPVDHERCLAIGLAARTLGVSAIALSLFAESFPEHAARLDRESLNRLAQATLMERNGEQWRSAAEVAKARLRIHVEPDSLAREMKRRRRALLGPPRSPESH